MGKLLNSLAFLSRLPSQALSILILILLVACLGLSKSRRDYRSALNAEKAKHLMTSAELEGARTQNAELNKALADKENRLKSALASVKAASTSIVKATKCESIEVTNTAKAEPKVIYRERPSKGVGFGALPVPPAPIRLPAQEPYKGSGIVIGPALGTGDLNGGHIGYQSGRLTVFGTGLHRHGEDIGLASFLFRF